MEVDGIVFASKREAKRYKQLKMLESTKRITKLELQKSFILQPAFERNGKKLHAIKYVCDFFYYDDDTKQMVVEDVKGFKTPEFKLKWKMMKYEYKHYEYRLT